MNSPTLLCGDCLELMKRIPNGSIDMVLSDLPYGTTRCRWDTPINLQELWKQYRRVVKENGAIVLFSAQPFTTELISSNKAMYRYEWIWRKTQPSGFMNAKKMPLRTHENIEMILSRLVDTFFSRISLTMPPAPKSHNTAYVLPWEEPLHWQSRSSGYSSS